VNRYRYLHETVAAGVLYVQRDRSIATEVSATWYPGWIDTAAFPDAKWLQKLDTHCSRPDCPCGGRPAREEKGE
jgi:hypothetical protein